MSTARMPALFAAAALASACTAGVPNATTSVTSSPSTSSTTPATGRPTGWPDVPKPWAAAQPPTSCPVTLGTPGAAPPSSITGPTAQPVPWADNWYGNDALWTRLPPTGVLPALGEAGNLSTKFPWWRIIPGSLTFQARRLDGPSEGFSGYYPSPGYGDLGFVPSGLSWPDTGCWQVTGTVSGHSLTFTVWVQRFPEHR